MNKQHEEDIQIQIIIDYDRRHLLTDKLYYFKSTNGPDLFRKKNLNVLIVHPYFIMKWI